MKNFLKSSLVFTVFFLSAPSLAQDRLAADLQVRIFEIEEQMRSLNGRIDEMTFENRKLKEDLQSAQGQIQQLTEKLNNQPVASPQTPVNNPFAVVESPVNPTNPVQPVVAPDQSEPQNIQPPSTGGQMEMLPKTGQEYSEAFAILSSGDYATAQTKFQSFIDKYPTDPLVGNAYYWLGETHYVRGDYESASLAFRSGFGKDPKGKKAADNLLKLAMSLSRMGMKDDACVVLREIPKTVPNTPQFILERINAESAKTGC